ncbi:MAG: diguanylate cyclase [Anaerolineae bacterium]|nr:diguanylate cyclase [Anaerolineae bacterium]
MTWQISPSSFLFFAAAGVALVIVITLWQRRTARGALTLALLMLAVGMWSFANGMELALQALQHKTSWFIFSLFWAASTPLLLFLFALQYTRRTPRPTRWKAALLWLPLLAALALYAIGDPHHLLWSEVEPAAHNPSLMRIEQFGAGVVALLVYLYVLFLAASGLLIWAALVRKGIYRRQSLALLAGIPLPLVVGALYLFSPPTLGGVDFTPIALTLMGGIFTLGIYRLRMFELLPVAREVLFETLNDGLLVVDGSGHIVDANRAACALLGVAAADLLGKPAHTALARWQGVAAACGTGVGGRLEFNEGMGTDTRTIEALIQPLESQQVGGCLIQVRDITTHKQRESELLRHHQHLEELVEERTARLKAANLTLQREIEERQSAESELRALLAAMTDVILVMDSDGRYRKIAPTNPNALYRPAEDLLGKTYHDIMPAETADAFVGYIRQVLTTRQPLHVEYMLPIEGTPRWFDATITPMTDALVVWVARDITERKQAAEELERYRQHLEDLVQERAAELTQTNARLLAEAQERRQAEEALRHSHLRYRALFEDSPISLWEQDFSSLKRVVDDLKAQGVDDLPTYLQAHPETVRQAYQGMRALDVNRATLELYGYASKEELLASFPGKTIDPLHPSALETLLAVAEGKTSFENEIINTKANGEPMVVYPRWMVAPGHEQTYDRVMVSVVDITARKQAEEGERAARRLAEALRDSALAMSSSLDLNVVLDKILESLTRVLPFDLATLYLVEEGGIARAARQRGFVERNLEDVLKKRVFRIEEVDDLRRMTASHAPVILPDLRQAPGWVWLEGLEWLRSYVGAPILINDEVAGFIELDSATPNFYRQEHADQLMLFAWQAGAAIRNARLFGAVQSYAREVESLRQVVLTTASSLDYGEVLRQTLEQIGRIIPSDSASLSLRDGDMMVIRAYRGPLPEAEVVGKRFPLHDTTMREALQHQRPFRFPDVQAEVPSFRVPPHNITRSVLVTPLIVRGEVIGNLNLDSFELDHFTAEDEHKAEAFAAQVAIALQNADLYQQMQRQLMQQSVLNEVSRIVSSSLALDEVAARVYQQVSRFMQTRFFMVAAYDEAAQEWYSIYLHRDHDDFTRYRWSSSEGMSGYVFETRQPLFLRNAAEVEAFLRRTRRGSVLGLPKSIIVVPMIVSERVVGALGTQDEEVDNAYSDQDFELLCNIASQVAVAFENARLFEQTQKLATTDGLTGIHNRRHFFVLAETEFARAVRYNKPLALIMIDLDHFKLVNDTFGHSAGDLVLQTVTRRCAETLRKIDIFGRYGGEEFVILMPETGLEGARQAAERLRTLITESEVPTPRGTVRVTASFGVAALDENIRSLDALLEAADSKLLCAKQGGRNCVQS